MLLLMPQEMVSKAGLAACSRRLQQHLQDARVAHRSAGDAKFISIMAIF